MSAGFFARCHGSPLIAHRQKRHAESDAGRLSNPILRLSAKIFSHFPVCFLDTMPVKHHTTTTHKTPEREKPCD
jgi:hypothetical protein